MINYEDWPLAKGINLDKLMNEAYQSYLKHGFEDDDRVILLKVHMELSEIAEVLRTGTHKEPADHIGVQGFAKLQEEISDAIILLLILAGKNEVTVTDALRVKHQYNAGREYKHGKRW
jgi:phosphoribosyl-ATP pyrophosphohydrolase